MTERQPLRIDVDCYAGHRGEQTPCTLMLGERRLDVAEVLDAWLAPEYRYFKTARPRTATRTSSATMSDPTLGS